MYHILLIDYTNINFNYIIIDQYIIIVVINICNCTLFIYYDLKLIFNEKYSNSILG